MMFSITYTQMTEKYWRSKSIAVSELLEVPQKTTTWNSPVFQEKIYYFCMSLQENTVCNTNSNAQFHYYLLISVSHAFVSLLYTSFYLKKSDPKPTHHAPISSSGKPHVTPLTPRMNMVPKVYKRYFKMNHSHQMLDSLSQELKWKRKQ